VLIAAAAVSLVPADLSYRLVESRFRKPTAKSKSHKALVIGLLAVTPLFVSIVANRAANTGLGLPRVEGKFSNLASRSGCLGGANLDKQNCFFGVEEPKFKAVLIGDSNARSASDGVANAVSSLSGRLFISWESGCSFLIDVKDESCRTLNEKRLGSILKFKPDMIFLVNYQNYLTDSVIKNVKKLDETLEVLSSFGIPVVVQGQIPECIYPISLALFRGTKNLKCEPSLESQLTRKNLVVESRRTTIQYVDNVFVDPAFAFCEKSECDSFRESWIYSDLKHLSPTGSKLLTPLYVEAIQKVLATKRP
jgi:hypothetical protein